MAELQLTYRRGCCQLRMEDYCEQCHTCAADMIGCDMYDNGKTNACLFPFGDCRYAVLRVGYLATTTKNYQMEPEENAYNPHLNCMIVRLRGKIYKCTKVKLDGETVYDSEQEDEE